ncbi:MAG: restriction endonuclease subunit S [Propionibacteriaceae bacterium]|nr:restriction endonuclease subunit S [Propionibacteriaceae bacterium]
MWGELPGESEVDVAVIRVTELKPHGGLDVSTAAERSVATRQLASRELREGDLIFEKSGGGPNTPVGRVALIPRLDRRTVFSNFMQLLRPSTDAAEPRFLHLFLTYYHESGQTAQFQTATTNIRNIKASEFLESVDVPLPPLAEQRRIVAILEDHLTHLDAAADRCYRAARRASALVDHAAIRTLLGSETTDRFALLDDNLPDLPHGWVWSTLGDVSHLVGGITKDAKTQSDPSLPEIPYLRVANVQRGRLDLSHVTTIRVPLEKVNRLILKSGDVLLNEGGDRDKLARGWVWQEEVPGCIHQNHVFRARPDTSVVDPYWLSWVANTIGASWALRHGKQSVNLASISLSTISQMPVPLPPLTEQRALLGKIDHLAAGTKVLNDQMSATMAQAQVLRRSLLSAAFCGDLTADYRKDS